MKKLELERMLMEPEGLKKLAERASQIKEKYGDSTEAINGEVTRQKAVELSPDQIRPTYDESRFNDDNHFGRGNLLSDLRSFFPELENMDSQQALQMLTERYKSDPTLANQSLVEDAINWVISGVERERKAGSTGQKSFRAERDNGGEETVGQAIQVLSEIEAQGDNIWTRLYQHSDFKGWSYYISLATGLRYRSVAGIGDSYNDQISSLHVGSSANDKGEVILFEHDRFVGRYARFVGKPGSTVPINYVGGFMNDRTSSVLIVRRADKEVSIPLGSLGFREKIAEYADSVPKISLRGKPILTWDMWPSFDSNKELIYLRIPVEVDVPNWWDYDAEIRYWLYSYVDTAGSLRAYVASYGCWVESGVKSGKIADAIMEQLPSTVNKINTELSNALGKITPLLGPLASRYLLPGTAAATGHTEDDVTIVLVRK